MMKFLHKKLVLADMVTPNTDDQYHCSGSHYLPSLLPHWLHNLNKLYRRIRTYLSTCASTHSPAKKTADDTAETPLFFPRTDTSDAISWAPLIKTKSSRHLASTSHPDNGQNISTLAGQTVLCVGGRSRLYPIYNRLTEHMEGRLLTFHGDSNDQLKDLPRLLEKTDMIICPIDCVNHEAFFMVKFYCRFTGKPCVLLERSEANLFQHGIKALSNFFK